MIEGVQIVPKKCIPDDRGKIMHIMKSTDDQFLGFGEVYCSTVYPGIVKGWHMHKEMTLNYIVLKGNIKFVLYDGRKNSKTFEQVQEIIIGENNFVMVTVPPMVWNGFKGTGLVESFVINFTDIPHDPEEIVRMDPHDNDMIQYNWGLKDR
ncbi:dTDP-4-dehydrorhamnose 3,5-epimerase family protein [Candidatus Pacearchaeota archaeon]|nr:dTDP-4-dehydrorhamnose 3,5-epimerase family protein [Candidatus Pacearchaeota archaeon]